MRKAFLLALILSFGLTACATTYQELGLSGGYSHIQLDPTTYMVSFRGNGFTPRERVELYLLYRCAELTSQANYDSFVLLSTDTQVKTSTHTTPGQYRATTTSHPSVFHGTTHTTTGTYTPGHTYDSTRYESTAVIKMLKGPKPEDTLNAYYARDLLIHLGPQVQR